MTDHPTRRLPDDTRPDRPPGSDPTPPTPGCRWCGGEVRAFPAIVQTLHGAGPVELENPDGPLSGGRFGGRPPHAPCYGRVCLDCGYTELYTEQPRQLLGGP
jgi:hypothetical protein